MRSAVAVALGVLLSACALGVGGDGEIAATDAGQHHDAAPFATEDAAAQPDEGSPLPPTTSNDAGGGNAPDSGNNNTSGCSFTGVLATYDLTSLPGNETSASATKTASGVTAGALSRASALTATSGLDSINSSNWTTSTSVDKTRYYTFTITPSGGCALDLTSITIGSKSSSTGPTKGAVATSDDQFSATSAFTPGSSAASTLSVSGATGAVEVRVYGFGASSTSGTLRIGTTLTISGALN